MSNDQSPLEKVGNNLGKWILGTITTITAIVSFVNLMRGNFQLGLLIFIVLLAVNLVLLLLYVIFYSRPASARSKKKIYPYQKYRGAAVAGLVLFLIVVVSALSMRSNRDFIVVAARGTATATALPTPTTLPTSTALPPATTMLVTVKAADPCLVDSTGVFNDITRKDTLDIGINNNSDRSLMITSAVLKPVWITASQWMGPTGVTATYDVALDDWWNETRLLDPALYAMEGAPTPPPDLNERIARVGLMTWTRPSPLEVREITGDKFTIKANSQDRFQLVLGLSQTYQFMWGSLILELTMDNGQTLTSEPLEFAVCYEPNQPAIEPPATPGPVVPNPETDRAGMTWFAWNDPARQDQGGVVVEISRVVLAETSRGLDFQWDFGDFDGMAAAGEIFFKIQNNTDKPQLILPYQMDFKLDQTEGFQNISLEPGIGQGLDGYIGPGETKFGSLRFTTMDFTPSQIKSLHMDLGCAFNDLVGCSGPGFKFDIDLSTPAQDPLPETLRKLLSP